MRNYAVEQNNTYVRLAVSYLECNAHTGSVQTQAYLRIDGRTDLWAVYVQQ